MKRNSAKPLLSVVVITLNEEKRLPRLLACLDAQTFQDFEVIVADAKSMDKTRTIAKRWGAKVIDGGLPSKGRNAGLRAARGRLVQFFDADVEPVPDFLERNVAAFTKRGLAIGSTKSTPTSGSFTGRFFYAWWDGLAWLAQRVRAYAAGYALLVRRDLALKVKGFDERIRFAEDIEFTRRVAKHGRFGILPVAITVSDRRYVSGGALRSLKTYLRWFWNDLFRPSKLYGHYDYVLGQHAEQRSRQRRSKRRL